MRHLRLSDAYDHFPAWDPGDNAHGEWNSEFDNLSLRNASRVWVDHCTFDDGQRPDSNEPTLLGQRMQKHDGLLDITRGADLVTVSYNVFEQHDKTVLVGHSDSYTADAGKLRRDLLDQRPDLAPGVGGDDHDPLPTREQLGDPRGRRGSPSVEHVPLLAAAARLRGDRLHLRQPVHFHDRR